MQRVIIMLAATDSDTKPIESSKIQFKIGGGFGKVCLDACSANRFGWIKHTGDLFVWWLGVLAIDFENELQSSGRSEGKLERELRFVKCSRFLWP